MHIRASQVILACPVCVTPLFLISPPSLLVMPHRLRRSAHVEIEHEAWINAVKEYQKRGTEARSKWHDYCDLCGRGTRDPHRHSALFLKTFFEQESSGSLPVRLRPAQEKPEKDPYAKPPLFESAAAACVKTLQTSSRELRKLWAEFCDQHGAGVRDPARHPPDFAQRFLDLAVDSGLLCSFQVPSKLKVTDDKLVTHDGRVHLLEPSSRQRGIGQPAVRYSRRAQSAPATSSRTVFARLERKALPAPQGLRERNTFLEVIPPFTA